MNCYTVTLRLLKPGEINNIPRFEENEDVGDVLSESETLICYVC